MARLGFTDAAVQNFGTARDVLIRLPVKQGVTSAQAVRAGDGGAEEARPDASRCSASSSSGRRSARSCSRTARSRCSSSRSASSLYLAFRFEWKFGVSAIIANLHDVVIILGFFALFQWEFSLPVLAAVLAVLGYSVNESVVVFDRVRENFRNRRFRSMPMPQVHRPRDHRDDVAHHHHPRLHADHGAARC